MKRGSWLNFLADEDGALPVSPRVREALAKLDDALYALWNLGDNVILAWTHSGRTLYFLSVRHYAIAETVHGNPADSAGMHDASGFISEVLSGPKYLELPAFSEVCQAFGSEPVVIPVDFQVGTSFDVDLISRLVRRYSVSLVRGRAVVLLDVVEFSLQSPLDQMAMLNSLAYSVNSAYWQLLSKDIKINFARTTTGDGFYIWNRNTAADANTELYKLMMMILADNAVAHSKAIGAWVPKLRAAFHVGEHYEFHQVEGLNPTTFSYIVGQVTVDLQRMVDKALPGQILLGDFLTEVSDVETGGSVRYGTLDFVENTAATLDQLNGLDISGGRIETIRCYITGQRVGDDRYLVNRYHIRDKHGMTRVVYNAKINIHRGDAEPIFLGVRNEALSAFLAAKVEVLNRDAAETGAFQRFEWPQRKA